MARHELVGQQLGSCKVDAVIDGTPVHFTRRRYSEQWYCWVDAWIDGEWQTLYDPWPCSRPKNDEIAEAIRLMATEMREREWQVR